MMTSPARASRPVNDPSYPRMTTHLNPAELNNANRSNSPRRIRRQANTDAEGVNTDSTPLMETENINPPRPPMANPEDVDDDMGTDDRETVNQPYPGVDDGFFTPPVNTNNGGGGGNVPDVEIVPNTPSPPVDDGSRMPPVRPTIPPGNGNRPMDPRDKTPERRPSATPLPHYPESNPGGSYPPLSPRPDNGHHYPEFPYAPGYGPDSFHTPGVFSEPPESIPDVNVYQHKKTLAQGMMDLALFSANANQLRYVLESYNRHPYYYPSVVFIIISLLLQVAIGVGLIWNARYNVKDDKEICLANKVNNFTVIGIFVVTVVNVFISAFGVATPA